MPTNIITADELETMLRDTVGDPASNPSQRWTSDESYRYLNRGATQLALHLPLNLETKWEISTVASTRTYLMPVDFISDKRVEYVVTALSDERLLTYLDEEEWKRRGFNDDKASTGQPQYYTYQRNLGDADKTTHQPKHIVLYPVPDAIKTLRVYGFKLPEAVVSSATLVPENMAPKLEAIVFWAAHLMSADDNDDVRADRFEARFLRQVNLINSFNLEASHSRAPFLKPWRRDRWDPELPHQRRVQ